MEKNINCHFTCILLMKISHLCSCYIHSSEIQFFQTVYCKISCRKTRKNYKGELLNVLCFLNISSALGHEVVHITSTALSIYLNCAGVFLIKLEIDSRPVTLLKKMLYQRGFPVNTLESSVLLQQSLT